MASYTRQSTFSDGDLITAELFNDEYNQLLAAFENTTGHKHDGTVGEGPVISIIGDAGLATPLNKILIDTTNDHIEFWVDVSGTSTQQLYITDGAILPVTDNDIDLGSNSLQFKDLYINGTANIDTVDIDAGTIDGVTIGGSSAGAITGTTITATNFVIGSASINETELEILDGATLTTTELNYVDGVTSSIQTQIDTKAPLASPSLTGIPTAPTAASNTNTTQIATTAYVQTEITDLIDAAPGTLDTLNELAAAINDDANYNTTLTTALATKLPLAGGTMTGNVTYSDNVKAQFGTSQDLQIYHDSANSHIKNTGLGSLYIAAEGTGDLFLRGEDDIFIQPQGGENGIVVQGNGAVTLYHNNASKLTTTSTGIDVTGTTSTDGLNVSGAGTIINSGVNSGTALTVKGESGNGLKTQYIFESGTNQYNWQLGFSTHASQTFSITPSTAANGTTFSNPVLNINQSGAATFTGNVTLSSTAPLLYLTNTTSGTGKNWRFSSASNGKLYITQEGVIDAVTLDHTTGNATFAGAISAEDNIYLTDAGTTRGRIELNASDRDDLDIVAVSLSSNLKFFTQNTEVGRFDASGNFGIGTASPAHKLTLAGGNFVLNNAYGVYFGDGNTGMSGRGSADTESHVAWRTNGSERARINSSGQLLIGKTATDNTTVGTRIDGGGFISSVINGGAAILLNRLTSDGDIALFRKDGTTIGSIGVGGSNKMTIIGTNANLQLGASNAALLNLDTNKFYPQTDNSVDLGFSSSANRFRDLYLTGTANFGSLSDGTITITGFVDEDNMSSNSATLVPTQQSVKAYVDSQIGSVDTLAEILLNGNTTGGTDIKFGDDDKALFGAGNDLKIYHSANNQSYIHEVGSGDLNILATNLKLQDAGGSNRVVVNSTGIDVTGTVTSSSDVIIASTVPRLILSETDVTNGNWDFRDSFGILKIRSLNDDLSTAQNRLEIGSNGDISFYDDTGTTQTLFWDASAESLGIGTTSPSHKLTIEGTTSSTTTRVKTTTGNAIYRVSTNNSDFAIIGQGGSNRLDVYDNNGSATRLSLDSSGNFLVGKTSTSGSTAGISLKSNGQLEPTVSGNYVSYFNRTSSDGPISHFAKDGTLVGSIGTFGSDVYIGNNDSGLRFEYAGLNAVTPFDVNSLSSSDGATDLGYSNSRFKDLHLSGTANVAGGIQNTQTTTGFGYLNFGDTDDANVGQIGYDHSSNYMRFQVNNTEKARIDSSGNLLVGKTSSGLNTAGVEFASSGRSRFTRDGNNVVEFNRKTSDGSIVSFSKDASLVGSIGSNASGGSSVLDITASAIMRMVVGGSTEAMRINSSGSVGIGETSPDGKLHIKGGTATGDASHVLFENTQGSKVFAIGGGASGVTNNNLYIRNVTDNTTPMVITDAGNATFSGNVNLGSSNYLRFTASSSGSDASVLFGNSSGTGGSLTFKRNSDSAALAKINGTGQLLVTPLGVTTPSFAFTNDTNTGMTRPTGDTLQFVTAGQERVRITDAGSVGIGTSSPAEKLTVSGNQNITGKLAIGISAAHGSFDFYNQNTAYFNGAVTIDDNLFVTSGSVGINTTSPSTALEVNNASAGATVATFEGSYSGSGDVKLASFERVGGAVAAAMEYNDATTDMEFGTTTSHNFSLKTADTRRLTIASGGDVSISGNVQVGIGNSKEAFIQATNSGRVASNPAYSFNGDVDTGMFNPNTDNTIAFATGGSERARIDSSGRLGIKNSNPTATLTVGALSSGQTGNVVINNEGGNTATLEVLSRTNRSILKIADNDTTGYISAEGGLLSIGRNSGLNAANINIDSSNNIGIGTTSPDAPLTVHNSSDPEIRFGYSSTQDHKIAWDSSKVFIHADPENANGSSAIGFSVDGTEKARIDASGNFLVGKTSLDYGEAGAEIMSTGTVRATVGNGHCLMLNRKTSDGSLIEFRKDNSVGGIIGIQEPQDNAEELYIANGTGTNSVGLAFWDYTNTSRIAPCNGTGAYQDNSIDLGFSSARFDDIYATNGTIQTSDRNDKQDIQALTAAETRVATACKGLLRKFRWQDAVTEKGDEARYHFGIISQDLQDAFTAEGLDAGDYGMFISETWEDSNGVEQTRLGVRYSELLAFIIAAI